MKSYSAMRYGYATFCILILVLETAFAAPPYTDYGCKLDGGTIYIEIYSEMHLKEKFKYHMRLNFHIGNQPINVISKYFDILI